MIGIENLGRFEEQPLVPEAGALQISTLQKAKLLFLWKSLNQTLALKK